MFKILTRFIVAITLLVSPPLAFASFNCGGDGDQAFSPESDGNIVRYFASINEFEIDRVSDNKVIVTDTVNCRYGRDALIDIEKVEFLDKTVSVEDLIVHNKTKELSLEVLRAMLYDKLFIQITARGVDPTSGTSTGSISSNEVVSLNSASNTYTSNTYNSIQTSNSVFSSRFIPGTYSSSIGSNSYYGQYNTGGYGGYSSLGSTYQTSGYNSGYSYQPVQLAPGSVVATWAVSAVGTNSIIYFEAIDSKDKHHFLGSALGYQGSQTLQLPPDLLETEDKVTIYIRSGSRVIKTFDVMI